MQNITYVVRKCFSAHKHPTHGTSCWEMCGHWVSCHAVEKQAGSACAFEDLIPWLQRSPPFQLPSHYPVEIGRNCWHLSLNTCVSFLMWIPQVPVLSNVFDVEQSHWDPLQLTINLCCYPGVIPTEVFQISASYTALALWGTLKMWH